jgi:hypothetical protein
VGISILDGNLIAEDSLLSFFHINLLGLAELELVEHRMIGDAIVRHGTARVIGQRVIARTIVEGGSYGLEIGQMMTRVQKICPASRLPVSLRSSVPTLHPSVCRG